MARRSSVSVLLLALALCAAAAAHAANNSTLLAVASSQSNLSILTGAVQLCPTLVTPASQTSTAVTLFAPTDTAFVNALAALNISTVTLLGNQTLLCSLLQYHIVASVIPSTAATSTLISVPTLLSGSNITIQLVGGKVKVNNATVLTADVEAGASIVHIIDQVLLPPSLFTPAPATIGITGQFQLPLVLPGRLPPMPPFPPVGTVVPSLAPIAPNAPQTIASVASSVPDLFTLVAAVTACPSVLTAATDPTTAVTVFAPTNNAFNEALTALNISATTLLGNQTLLCSVLQYHIVASVIPSTAATSTLISVPTLLSGSNITIQLVSGKVKVNNATVTTADVKAGASIVHIIDKVLLPPFLAPNLVLNATIASVASKNLNLSTLVAAVSACPPLLAAATNSSTAVTVFAPTNKAFATALAALNISAAALLDNQTLVCSILEYHIVGAVIPSKAATSTAISVPTLLPNANVTIQLVKSQVKVDDANVTTADINAGASVIHIIDQMLLPPFLLELD